MGEGFAEGEAHLVGVVYGAAEDDRDHFGCGARLGAAGVEDGFAAGFVVGEQFFCAGMEAVERQVVAWQDEGVGGDRCAERVERADVDAEGVTFGVHGLDADVGGDARHDLVGGEEDVVGRAMEHHLFGCVAAAGQHLPLAAADVERFAGDEAAEGGGQAGQHAQIAVAVGEQFHGDVRGQAVAEVEAAVGLGFQLLGPLVEHEAGQVFGLAHAQGRGGGAAEPACHAGVVGVEVGDDHAGDGPGCEHRAEEALPDGLGFIVADAGVEHGPAGAVFQKVDVHVVEAERECEAEPVDAGRDLLRGAELGAVGEGEVQGGCGGCGQWWSPVWGAAERVLRGLTRSGGGRLLCGRWTGGDVGGSFGWVTVGGLWC